MTKKKAKRLSASAQAEPSGDYEVGYRKPPAEHRFQQGRSGNPRGRPRGRKNFGQMLTSILHGKVSISDKTGRIRNITRVEAMLQNVIAKAVSGEPKQVALVVDLMERFDVKVVEQQPIRGIRVEYVKPKIPRRFKQRVAEDKAWVQAAEARRQREREVAQRPPIEPPTQPAAPQHAYRRYHALMGRQRRL